MDDSKLERWGAWAGIAFVVLVLVTAFLPGSPPKPSDSTAKITTYFADKADEIRIITYLGGLATVAVFFWLGALGRFLRRGEGAGPMLATSAVAGGVFAAVMNGVGGIILAAVTVLRLQNSAPKELRFYYVLANMFTIVGGFGIVVLLAAVSLVALRSAVLPRWVAALGGVAIVLWIVATGGVTSTKDWIFYFGLAGFALFAIWVVVVSIMMMRTASTSSDAPAFSEPSAA